MEQQKKVLIIDDDIRHLIDARQCLREQGYEVSIHDYPIGAPAIIRQFNPDIVLLNIGMHDLSEEKLSFLLHGARQFRELSVIFYAAQDEDTLRRAALRHGVSGHIRRGEIPAFRSMVENCAVH